jgi:Uma2 family endonuclease
MKKRIYRTWYKNLIVRKNISKFDKKTTTTMIETISNVAQLPRTLAEFMNWEPEDGFKYEWNDGELIKFENMKKKHLMLINKLYRLFYKTMEFQRGGLFLAEQDVQLSGIQLRRPDLAFFSNEQINNSLNDEEQIPAFVIEIISSNDQINTVEDKVIEYFKAGVRVVWHIFPRQKTVYVYTSRRDVTICIENDICSAAPVLSDFQINVDQLFSQTV